MNLILEDYYYLFFGIFAIGMAISWIAFSRISMARIERVMEEEGKPRLAQWDGVGARAVFYAYAIGLPLNKVNRADDPFFDVLTARHYANKRDKKLARAFLLFGNGFVVYALVGGWIIDYFA